MNPKHVVEMIDDYLDGRLSPAGRREVDEHVAVCSDCRRELQSVASVIKDLHALPTSLDVPQALYEDLARLTEQQKNQRYATSVMPAAFRYAAMIVMLVGAGVFAWMTLRDESAGNKANTLAGQSEQPVERDTSGAEKQSHQPAEREPQAGVSRQSKITDARPPLAVMPSLRDTSVSESIPPRITFPPVAEILPVPEKQRPMVNHSIVKPVQGIMGRVLDAQSGEELIGANIVVEGTPWGSASDINGRYLIKSVPEGEYTLRASFIGYAPVLMKKVSVEKDGVSMIDFRLEATAIQVEAVEVTAVRPMIQRNATKSVLVNPNSRQVTSGYVRGGRTGNAQFFVDGATVGEQFNTEQYNKINETGFKDALSNPLSTFSIDVDAASYANVRRFINNGSLPPKDAVRIEEMVNYFQYDYPRPKGPHPFSITSELSECPWNKDHALLLVGLQGKTYPAEELPPSNLVFLLDVSGSMNEPNKLPLVQSAFRLLVNQLRAEDRVAVVVYAGQAGLVLPSTSGSEKEKILGAIEQLQAGGSTAGGAGIQLAYEVARENFRKGGNNRVVLATDGDFNVGISSDGELIRLIEKKRDDGIFLSVLGFGTGNYKDAKMEQLADRGNGNFSYIDNIHEARKVFVGQMMGTLYTIAKDVKIQIEFNPAFVKSYRLVGYENRRLNKEDFEDDKKDAGELGAGHSVTALYELILHDSSSRASNKDSLRYQMSVMKPESLTTEELLSLKLRYKLPDEDESRLITETVKRTVNSLENASGNLRFASAVASYGMILRDSEFIGDSNYGMVLHLCEGAVSFDPEGYRRDFVNLVKASRLLWDRRK